MRVPTLARSFARLLLGSAGLGLVLTLAGVPAVEAQCAMCRDAVAASPSETREAMNYAILGLAFTPYAVAALAAWTLSPGLRALVRARLRRISRLSPVRLP